MPYRINPFTGELDLVDTVTVPDDVARQFDADTGSAVPVGNILNLNGASSTTITTSASGNTVDIDISATYPGQASITTLGTVTTGTWNADIIPLAYGGTNANLTPSVGALLYTTATETALLTNGTTGQVLTANTGAAPSWGQPVSYAGWNGSIIETAAVSASSDGATITFSVEQSGGGDLQVIFSDGIYQWDTTPADTVTLTAGTDTIPTENYVYLLQSNKTLTVSTTGWPAAEHAPLATVVCQSASSFQTQGAYKFHAWTDHVNGTDNQGHVPHLNFWIRQQQATYDSGIAQTFTITTNGGAADNVTINTASGVVLQLHAQTFPAFTAGHDYYVVNDSVTPYTVVTDLNALLTDSAGVSMSGRYFSLVVWGVVSQDTADCKIFVNLPSGSYTTATGVTEDAQSYANFSIPNAYIGTGFLIAQWNLRHQAAASGTWTSIDEIDLRGLSPSISPGGTAAAQQTFSDSVFRIFDDADDSKEIAFQASAVSGSTTRTITMLDADIDLADVVQGPGSATDNALARYDGTSGKLLQDSTVLVSDNGEMTNASQPAFSAYLAADAENKTGDGTTYTIGTDALTEIFDQNGDFNTNGTFTAPVTGRYSLSFNVKCSGLTSSHTRGYTDMITSNRTYSPYYLNWWAVTSSTGANIAGTSSYTVLADMDAADTATCTVTIQAGTLVVDIEGSAVANTYFMGHLVC